MIVNSITYAVEYKLAAIKIREILRYCNVQILKEKYTKEKRISINEKDFQIGEDNVLLYDVLNYLQISEYNKLIPVYLSNESLVDKIRKLDAIIASGETQYILCRAFFQSESHKTEKIYSFRDIISNIKTENAWELKADIYMQFNENYIFATMYYESAINTGSATAACKLARFYRDICENQKMERKYLNIALTLNYANVEALYYLARLEESDGDIDKAITLLQNIINILHDYTDYLEIDEFDYLCAAYKRLCIIYYSKSYSYAIAIFYIEQLFELWNALDNNKIAKDTDEYRKRYYIKGAFVSAYKVYGLYGDKEKEAKYMKLCGDADTQLIRHI